MSEAECIATAAIDDLRREQLIKAELLRELKVAIGVLRFMNNGSDASFDARWAAALGVIKKAEGQL